MAANDLTTLGAVKQWLGLSSDSDDGLLVNAITACSAAIQNYLNRNIAVQGYTETRSGTGGVRMQVANYPLISVTSVAISGQLIPQSSDGWVGAGWASNDDRGITLIGYRFPLGVRNVQFTYSAGYELVPDDLSQACCEWVAFKYRERDRIGHQSKGIQGETVSFITAAMPAFVTQVLAQYKKVVPL